MPFNYSGDAWKSNLRLANACMELTAHRIPMRKRKHFHSIPRLSDERIHGELLFYFFVAFFQRKISSADYTLHDSEAPRADDWIQQKRIEFVECFKLRICDFCCLRSCKQETCRRRSFSLKRAHTQSSAPRQGQRVWVSQSFRWRFRLIYFFCSCNYRPCTMQ